MQQADIGLFTAGASAASVQVVGDGRLSAQTMVPPQPPVVPQQPAPELCPPLGTAPAPPERPPEPPQLGPPEAAAQRQIPERLHAHASPQVHPQPVCTGCDPGCANHTHHVSKKAGIRDPWISC